MSPKVAEVHRLPISERVASLPRMTPPDVDARLVQMGYRGQVRARRAAAVMAYRHVRRLQQLFVDRIAPTELSPRDNYLFLGPTGSGKTYLVELLFREILRIPTLVVDVTQYSETGYIGEDVNNILSHLYEAAEQDVAWAACGVVCLDEFDKLASSRSNARFAGEGTTKDVSGFGVQRSLLTLLSGEQAPFAVDFGYSHMGPKAYLPLAGLTFIACGAFSGLKATADFLDNEPRVGFGRDAPPRTEEEIAVHLGDHILEQTTAFARYGFLPELIGRFSRVVAFEPLDEATLKEILLDNVLTHYQKEFSLEGLQLLIDTDVIDFIVESAQKSQLGARGLRNKLVTHLEDAAFTHFGQKEGHTVRLQLNNKLIVVSST